MSFAKNESRNNNNRRDKCNQKKRPLSALQTSKVCTDGHKSKLESSTESRLPIFNKPRRVHNCVHPNNFNTPTTLKKPPLVLKRKSVSLLEFPSNTPKMKVLTQKVWESTERVHELTVREIVQTNVQVSSLGCNETDIARHVCKMFILNAWRHRNAQVSSMKNKLTKMGNEVDNLNIQVVVLRNLLESEKSRVATTMTDAAQLKQRLETELQEKRHLENRLSNLEKEKIDWENLKLKMVSEIHQLKDELTLTAEQNKYLRRECDDLEKIVSEAKRKESQLQGLLTQTNKSLEEKSELLNEVLGKTTNLLARMSEVTRRKQNLKKENEIKDRKINECINKIDDMSVALNNSQNICKVQNEEIEVFKKDLAIAEEKVKIQMEEMENLRKTVDEYKTTKEFGLKVRNRIIFEAIKLSANLFFPYHDIN